MNSKFLVLSTALAAMIGVGLWIGQSSENADAAAAAGLNWDGSYFTMTTVDSEGLKVVTYVDIAGNRIRNDYTEKDTPESVLSVINVGGVGRQYTTMTASADDQTFSFITGCSDNNEAPSVADFAPMNEGGPMVTLEDGVFSIGENIGEGEEGNEGVQIPVADDGGFATIKFAGADYPIQEISFDPIPDSIFAVPNSCLGDDEENGAVYNAYAEASRVEGRRRYLQSLPEEEQDGHRRLMAKEEADDARRTQAKKDLQYLRGRGLITSVSCPWWISWACGEITINMRYHRYCGPDMTGSGNSRECGKDMSAGVAPCGGPVSEVDKCCAFHDWKCGQDQSATGNTFGANRSSKKNGGNECLFGVHSGRCEHCSCTGALAQCAQRAAVGSSTCYAGGSCNARWTGVKVNAVFGTIPCWHDGRCTRRKCSWRRSGWAWYYWCNSESYNCIKAPMGRFAPYYHKTKCNNPVNQIVNNGNCVAQ